jgi:hypothetical protein
MTAAVQAMGLSLDLSGFGMGVRSNRYAAVIDNGVVSRTCQSVHWQACGARHALARMRWTSCCALGAAKCITHGHCSNTCIIHATSSLHLHAAPVLHCLGLN